jgi:hypothetical protein
LILTVLLTGCLKKEWPFEYTTAQDWNDASEKCSKNDGIDSLHAIHYQFQNKSTRRQLIIACKNGGEFRVYFKEDNQ